MEGLHCLKSLLEQVDILFKIYLKEAYLLVPLNKNSQKFVRFQCSDNLCKFLCLCFELRPAPRIFTRLLKIPIVLFSLSSIRIIIYQDDMLLIGRTLQEIRMSRDISILQHLGDHYIMIKLKKSVFHLVKQIEVVGLIIYTKKMTVAVTEKKLKHVCQWCQTILAQPKTSVLKLTKFIDLLLWTVQTILPAQIQFRYLQQEQILALQKKDSTVII